MRILVTGSAGGIGFAVAEKLAAAGHQLYLADINIDQVQAQASSCNTPAGKRRLSSWI